MNIASVTLTYTILPSIALVCTALLSATRPVSKNWISMFQHFAAGVVLSSVALELLPVLLKAGSLFGMGLGYIAGVALMIAIDRYATKAGTSLPIAIDLFIDGLLLILGFATGEKGGVLLLLGLTLETTALGMVLGPSLSAASGLKLPMMTVLTGFALAILAGAGFGLLLPQETGFWFAAILGFGVAALLYLVIEELITEAHNEATDTVFSTSLFFIGFLIPLLLGQISF